MVSKMSTAGYISCVRTASPARTSSTLATQSSTGAPFIVVCEASALTKTVSPISNSATSTLAGQCVALSRCRGAILVNLLYLVVLSHAIDGDTRHSVVLRPASNTSSCTMSASASCLDFLFARPFPDDLGLLVVFAGLSSNPPKSRLLQSNRLRLVPRGVLVFSVGSGFSTASGGSVLSLVLPFRWPFRAIAAGAR